MEFRILGPLEVVDEGRVLPLGGAKQRALLALLLLNDNEVVSQDRLVDALWGEEPPETAAKALHVYVSQLRKLLPPGMLATRRPGYLVELAPEQLDLERFERLLAQGLEALEAGRPEHAAALLAEALALWRGPALADFAYEPFAQTEIARLEELRLAALEERIEADLARGRQAELVGELEALVAKHPLRERLRAQLMLALYRAGRQAEALAAYQEARRTLVEELGIEPSRTLQRLEKAILVQDPSLEHERPRKADKPEEIDLDQPMPDRSILVVPQDEKNLAALLALAEPLAASQPPRELIMARLIVPSSMSSGSSAEEGELARATAELRERRAALIARGVAARVAAFTSAEPGEDIVRLASEQQVELLLLDGGLSLLGEDMPRGELGIVLARAPCDVAILSESDGWSPVLASDRPVLVPFGAAEHDWAALELGAWIARAHCAPLKLIGAAADPHEGRRDASRLLADASLLVQRCAGIVAEPLLAEPGSEGVMRAAERAGLVVVGLSDRWRREGLGRVRLAIAKSASGSTLFVRRGVRPGGLAPREDLTRFTWSLAEAGTRR